MAFADVFDWDDDGKMKAVVEDVPEALEEAIDGAAADCPVQAIIVE